MGYLSLKNWERFQHYKDRDPPWVKLYRALLSSEAWVLGTDQTRLVQIASILIAARYSNQIPLKWGLIIKVCNLDMSEQQLREAVEALRVFDFLEVHNDQEDTSAASGKANTPEQSASNVLATCTSEAEQSRAEQREIRADARARDAPHGTEDQIFGRVTFLKAKYPQGAAREDWIAAEKHCRRITEAGDATWEDLDAGVARYAKLCRATGRLVLNPANFFGAADRPWSQLWPLPASKSQLRQDESVDAAKRWLEGGNAA